MEIKLNLKQAGVLAIAAVAALSVQARGGKRLSEYVNPFIGATTNTQMAKAEHGLGKTFPGVATPWGMTQVSPNTITGGDNGSGYSYEHTTIEGFALTQMSGIGWYGDLGNYLVMPTTGPLHTYRGEAERPEEGYRSRYDKESETARAGYYAVRLTDYDIRAELTATPHGGVMRFTYPENECSRIQIDLARRVGGTSVRQYVERVDDYAIRGWMRCTPDGGGWGNGGGKADYTVYFYTRFSKPLERYGVWSAEFPEGMGRKLENVTSPEFAEAVRRAKVTERPDRMEGDHLGFYTEFLNAYSGCMLGNPAIAVIVDAYMKGIRGYDVEKAYRFARQTADRIGHHPELGYSPGGSGISETLEYGYFDWCVGEWAEALDKTEDAGIYHRRGQAYRKIFDKEKGWFRVRNADGSWADWPEKGRLQEWYGCMECNPYQQGWFVPHDVPGMVEIMGGRDKVLADLESFFENTPREFYWNPYYNHANEPVHHVPFLFNRLGAPWLTQYWTRVICADAYKNSLAGLCGNEDVGQMSAWYILASAGFHPLCPGETRYELTAPVFDRVEIALDRRYAKGRKFVVTTEGNAPDACYIQSATLNGKPYNRCYIDHEDIVRGGELHFVLGRTPNKQWGVE